MSFEKHSNFNKLANFSEVKFGENKPVLEVELNEMQQIQNEARADIIRDTMPSGFVTLGDIDYDYCANNDNQIKLKTESIAYVNGYRITIPKDTIIEIGEADKVREDAVFLEVWKEEVTSESTLTNQGGEGQAQITNHIKDSRYPVETSHRIALKWRIRHYANANFNDSYDGIGYDEKKWNQISWENFNNTPYPQGGNDSPLDILKSKRHKFMFIKMFGNFRGFTGNTFRNFSNIDLGLYTSGNGDSESKTTLKTVDGYVYAIPMFRLIRKPHVGLASPFEYKKIHNQLDPKKFAHLVGQENVEKVHSVNVKGKTYKNLVKVANSVRANQNTEVNIYLEPNTKYIAFGNFANSSNPGTFALLCLSTVYVPNGVLYNTGDDLYTHTVSGGVGKEIIANKTLNYITFNSENYPYCHVRSGGGAGGMFSDLMLFKYEDEMEELTLEYFKGVQSLGENTNNSITVENNLVAEGTYVHELQNHILPTHPEVTHVTWGEDVVIPPEVEIELKNGEEVIQTITQLPVKLETTGEEKLHVKTMKGKTLVNLIGEKREYINRDSKLYGWEFMLPYNLTSGKTYLAIFDVSGTIDESNSKVYLMDNGFESTSGNIDSTIPTFSSGHNVVKCIATNDIHKVLRIRINYNENEKFTVSNVMLIEYQEGMENWGLKYFEGMQSVKMPVLTTTGKNLFDVRSIDNAECDGAYRYVKIPIKRNTTYTLSLDKTLGLGYVNIAYRTTPFGGGELSWICHPSILRKDAFTFTNTIYDFLYINWAENNTDLPREEYMKLFRTFQFEEGSTATSYEPYKSNILSTPEEVVLRSLPNGVCDTLNLNTGEYVQRIEEHVLDGTTNNARRDWNICWGGYSTNTLTFEGYTPTKKLINTNGSTTTTIPKNFICDKVKVLGFGSMWQNGQAVDRELSITTYTGGQLVFVIEKSKLTTMDVSGFKQWLSQNPVTIQYELETPITKKIGLSENDYVGKSKVTYQLAEPLNYIPNGAYDEIKGDKLIKRTNKIYLDGTETWGKFSDETTTTYRTSFNIADGKPSSVCVCSHFEYGTGASVEKVKIYITVNANLSITVLKSDFPTVDSFKTWLSNNRPMVIYELANPIEIPLKEVSPLDVDFSLNRQFKREYGNCLKELPNGVKDVVENGKVKRNVKHLVVNGTENWTTLTTSDNNVRAFMTLSGAKPIAPTFNSYDFTHGTAQTNMNILGVDQNGNLVIGILKTLLTSPDVQGIKEYLSKKNLHVIYELQTPTTEELTEENSRYVPYMPLNSYVGSLYVADGINQTKFLTAFSPSEYEVQTYHRYFSNEFNVFEDTTLKKSPYGHKTYLEEVDGKYVEKFIAGLEKHEIEDLRHKVSLTGFDYSQLLQDSFLKLIKGELS